MKKIAILGSTGSIGINALKVISRFPEHFKVVGLTARENWELLAKQVKVYKPRYAAIDAEYIDQFRRSIPGLKVNIVDAQKDLALLAALPEVDIVILAISGRDALEPFLSAAKAGKQIAPANKEALVIAGDMIMAAARRSGATVIPVDSEQSAIFQCLQGQNRAELAKIYLTASGGALYNIPSSRFDALTVSDILKHPRWKMGKKITVDSATLMNKGFEVIEAQRLFSLDVRQIDVVVHPQAIIHSMVCFRDGSVLAQLGVTDMRLPIQYALTYPKRLDSGLEAPDFVKLGQLTFAKPDLKKFPCLGLAFDVAKEGGTLPAVLNAADEEAVEAFLKGRIRFSQIYNVVDKAVMRHKKIMKLNLSVIRNADVWARHHAQAFIKTIAAKN